MMLRWLFMLLIVSRSVPSMEQPLVQAPPITPDNAAALTLQMMIDLEAESFQEIAFGYLPDSVSARYAGEILWANGALAIEQDGDTLQPTLLSATAIAFSPDGTRAAIVAPNNELTVFDTQTGEVLTSIALADQEEPIFNIAIDPTNTYVAVAVGAGERVPTADTVFYVVDIQTSQIVVSLPRQTRDIAEPFGTGVAFSPDGTQAVLTTSDGLIRRWNLEAGMVEVISQEADGSLGAIQWLTDGRLAYWTSEGVAVSAGSERLALLTPPDLETYSWWVELGIVVHPTQPLIAFGLITDSEQLNAHLSVLQIWNTNTYEIVFDTSFIDEWPYAIRDIAFSPDGTLLAVGSGDGTLRVWGVGGGLGHNAALITPANRIVNPAVLSPLRGLSDNDVQSIVG